MNLDIYCDESRLELLTSKQDGFMVIGSLWLERDKRELFKTRIKELKKRHDFHVEVKWTKISYKMLDFYKELIDIFAEYEEFHFFRAIAVDTCKINFEYHQNNHEYDFIIFTIRCLFT